ncbi:hypothetical protein [Embleya sp. NPDC020630]|uniref:hypothetical protein n=1 Tax=Embleya sp. NPDC020630 TaxID=3363979 RepID=UPI0037A9C472
MNDPRARLRAPDTPTIARPYASTERYRDHRNALLGLLKDWCHTYTAGHLGSREHRRRPEVLAFGGAFDALMDRAPGTWRRTPDTLARLADTARALIAAMGPGDEHDDGNGRAVLRRIAHVSARIAEGLRADRA